ncbi:hypothetical protein Vretifemale_17678, partial [Volvox reticuliferus]
MNIPKRNSPESGQGSSRSGSPECSVQPTLDEERDRCIKRNLDKLQELGLLNVGATFLTCRTRKQGSRRKHNDRPTQPPRVSQRLALMPSKEKVKEAADGCVDRK